MTAHHDDGNVILSLSKDPLTLDPFDKLTTPLSLRGEGRGGVQTGYIVYKTNRAHGLQLRARRTVLCPGKKPVPWMKDCSLSQRI